MPRLNRQWRQGIIVIGLMILLLLLLNNNDTYSGMRNLDVGLRKVVNEVHEDAINMTPNEEQHKITNKPKTQRSQQQQQQQCSMKERSAHVRDTCARSQTGSQYDFLLDPSTSRTERHKYIYNMFSNDEHKLLTCFNSKAGSTTFKTVMTRYSKHYNASRVGYNVWDVVHGPDYLKAHDISRLHLLSDEDIIHRLKTYTRVTFVRHPFVRVYSAYKEKLATMKPPGCQYYQETMGVRILKAVRKTNLTAEEEKCGYSVTFPEFIEYFVGEGKTDILGDVHFQRFANRCNPCFVDYNFIVKLETADSDQEAFIEQFMNVPVEEKRQFHVNEGKNKGYTVDKYNTLITQYSQVNPAHLEALRDIYKEDMELYGYATEMGEKGLKALCEMSHNFDENGQCC